MINSTTKHEQEINQYCSHATVFSNVEGGCKLKSNRLTDEFHPDGGQTSSCDDGNNALTVDVTLLSIIDESIITVVLTGLWNIENIIRSDQ